MGTTENLTDTQYWYVYTGTTAASVRKDYRFLSGTSTSIKKASRQCFLEEPTYKVVVAHDNTLTYPKAYYQVSYGDYGSWRTGKLGYVLFRTSACTDLAITVTVSRPGSYTEEGLCRAISTG